MQAADKAAKSEYLRAAFALIIVLNIFFFPVIWGKKTLMLGVRNAQSVMPGGAYGDIPPAEAGRTSDPGAPAWCSEPWFKIISYELKKERTVPLWNPYSAYGTPLAANMQSQPFYPPSLLLSLHCNPYSYDLYLIFRLFVAGMSCYLFLRLFIDGVSAIAGSIMLMFSGYFISFLNMPHISADVMLPLVFYFFELHLRKRGIKGIVISSAAVFLTVVGGMPESTFLALSFGYMYFIFRLFTDVSFRGRKWDLVKEFAVANILGFSLSAFLLLPFVEFLKNSFNVHQNGDIYGIIYLDISELRNTLFYLVPHVFGSTLREYYWGLTPFIFALTAVAVYFRPPWQHKTTVVGTLVVFFAISVVLMFMKLFGAVAVNWIGYLPLSRFVLYPKYEESLLSFSVAALAAIGFSTLNMNIKPRYFKVSVFLTVCIIAAFFFGPFKQQLLAKKDMTSLVIPALVLIADAFILVYLYGKYAGKKYIVVASFSVLLIELVLNIAPGFYPVSNLPDRSKNPYQGAPYISFIKNNNRDYSRVFGLEGVLFPNWAGAFGLFDVRSLDAMNYSCYKSFIRNFLVDGKPDGSGDFVDRFTGMEHNRYTFSSLNEKRFLQLSSIKYLLSASSCSKAEGITNEIFAQLKHNNLIKKYENEGGHIGGGPQFFIIDGVTKGVLFQHPPSFRLPYRTVIAKDAALLRFAIGINPDTYKVKALGDGVGFTIEIKSPDAAVKKIFYKYIDPKNNMADRKWHEYAIDLSRYAGKNITLLFSTDPGPKNDSSFDWAGWGELKFTDANVPLSIIYEKEVIISEVANVLPRASVFYGAEVMDDGDKALSRLKDQSFNIFEKVIVDCSHCGESERSIVRTASQAPPQELEAARILSYQSQEVVVSADLKRPGILMLNDSNYPGWRAYVDGKEARILKADYLFRGVALGAGPHKVTFKYRPLSFLYGLFISAAAFTVFCIAIFKSRGNKDREKNDA